MIARAISLSSLRQWRQARNAAQCDSKCVFGLFDYSVVHVNKTVHSALLRPLIGQVVFSYSACCRIVFIHFFF